MLDFLLFLYLMWRASSAIISRPSRQINALLIRLLLLGALSGFFLITHLTGLIKTTFEQLTAESGFVLTLASIATAIILLLQLRSRILDKLDDLIKPAIHPFVSVSVGLVRGILMSWLLLVVLSNFPLGLFDSILAESVAAAWSGLAPG